MLVSSLHIRFIKIELRVFSNFWFYSFSPSYLLFLLCNLSWFMAIFFFVVIFITFILGCGFLCWWSIYVTILRLVQCSWLLLVLTLILRLILCELSLFSLKNIALHRWCLSLLWMCILWLFAFFSFV